VCTKPKASIDSKSVVLVSASFPSMSIGYRFFAPSKIEIEEYENVLFLVVSKAKVEYKNQMINKSKIY
jgi:hypothetical protein